MMISLVNSISKAVMQSYLQQADCFQKFTENSTTTWKTSCWNTQRQMDGEKTEVNSYIQCREIVSLAYINIK